MADVAKSPEMPCYDPSPLADLQPEEAIHLLSAGIEQLMLTTASAPLPSPPTPAQSLDAVLAGNLTPASIPGSLSAMLASSPRTPGSAPPAPPPSLNTSDLSSSDSLAALSSPVTSPTTPLNSHQDWLVRRFESKRPPGIPISDYLDRIFRYCPMSSAVYIAASLYLFRMSVMEKSVVITPKNVHRLSLAALRVAMKALEDRNYSHSHVAKVGGVAEPELVRMEINFCFLTDFSLMTREDMLVNHLALLRDVLVEKPLTPPAEESVEEMIRC